MGALTKRAATKPLTDRGRRRSRRAVPLRQATPPSNSQCRGTPSGTKGRGRRPPLAENTSRLAVCEPGAEHSAALRERLLADLSQLQSSDEAADWVHGNLPATNTLTHSDADVIGASFRERLAAIETDGSQFEEQSRNPDARGGAEGLQDPSAISKSAPV